MFVFFTMISMVQVFIKDRDRGIHSDYATITVNDWCKGILAC